jgi:phage terminase large subunit-like protein
VEVINQDRSAQKYLDYLKPHPCFGGLDLASVADLTAFCLLWPIKDQVYCYPFFFLPSEGLAERSKRDGVPYEQWAKEGFIELTPGSICDWVYVTDRLIQLAKIFKIREIGYDSWGARDVVTRLKDAGLETTDVSQTIQSLSGPSKRLQELILSKKLVHTGHPVLRWNLDCCTVYSDPNGNIKIEKPKIGKSSKRIDGIIALVIAISRYMKTPSIQKSIYATRGLLSL